MTPGLAKAQGPTILGNFPAPTGGLGSSLGEPPGTEVSRLGAIPGGGMNGLDTGQPSTPVSGRLGPGATRAPSSISTPGGNVLRPPSVGIAAPRPTERFETPSFGSFSIPSGPEEEGPPDGLTLDAAIEGLIRNNRDLQGKFLEIPQADADILTAGLRANPVFYADAQLIPYGSYTDRRPGGQTQYDINISYPLDLSGKRKARTIFATRAKRVIEAQYQNAVRTSIDLLYGAFVDVLAARQTVAYSQASVEGLKRLLDATTELYRRDQNTRADVSRVKVLLSTAEIGLVDSQEALERTKRELGAILFRPVHEAGSLTIKGSIDSGQVPSPPEEELLGLAVSQRPDLASYRLGLEAAEANVHLQLANRLSDVYVLYQPYTLQNNAPLGLKSAHSWALGVTVPLPLYDRNQGGIARAKLNVTQSQVELAQYERFVLTEVQQALNEYKVTRGMVDRIRSELEPTARSVRDDTLRLFTGGEVNLVTFLNAQREYQDIVKQYLDTLVRHRRATLSLNTAVGQRILP